MSSVIRERPSRVVQSVIEAHEHAGDFKEP
jgi:hypothetical protein